MTVAISIALIAVWLLQRNRRPSRLHALLAMALAMCAATAAYHEQRRAMRREHDRQRDTA
jgi:uncharacterized membrane protein